MSKQIIIAEQYRIAAVFSEDRVEELIVASGTHQVGDIHLGIVQNVLTSIDAAFVNIGDGDRNGFIHISDLGPMRLRRNQLSIDALLAPEQRVLVQVMKEPTGNKGPRLTANITLPGRYVVLMPFGRGVNLSRRIRNENERSRLRALAILIKPPGMGLLVRTEAEGMGEDQIIDDLDNLLRQWETIQQDAQTARQPGLLSRDRDFVQKVLRDVYSDDVNRIVIDTQDGWRRVKQYLASWGDGKVPPNLVIDLHQEQASILEFYRVNAAIKEALKPRVDLPSGGYIIIEPTEALTVIDVNSGSFTRSQTSQETVLWTNREAATEIARQLRLRNIAGVIIVDFIDMDSRRDQLQLLDHFNKCLRADKSRPQIAQLTELGLVEMTRKRQGQSIYELFGRSCPTCNGLGHLAHLPGEQNTKALDSGLVHWEAKDIPLLDKTEMNGGSPLAGGLEANLVNHPDYQERSPQIRRRSRPTPPVIKKEREPDHDPQPEQIQLDRSVRREPRKTEPPEVVVVEMTPEEQQVYSLMGISPVVLARQEVKDPRNAIVTVTLPKVSPTAEPVAPPAPPEPAPAVETVSSEEKEAKAVVESPIASRRRRGSSTTLN
ncbi:MAG: Rne/Rng family ribonuclease [Pseudanabaenaceae cyanobacterium]